jgi:hypothetical protein
MIWVSSIVLMCNVGGAGLMAKFGLPSAVPLVGRKDSDDSILGIVGLAIFVTSIAVGVTVVITSGTL